jgi:flagellar FliL protein
MVDVTAEETGEAEAEAAPPRKRLSGKKLVLFIVLPALLAIGGGGAGAWFFGLLDPLLGSAEEAPKEEPPKPVVFYELPEMLVNINTGGRQSGYLKLRVALELDDPLAVPRLEQLLPRIIDNFQVYLRELRPEDLTGSAGVYRLKEELLFRVNAAAQPTKIKDVLFKEMLVQ